MNDQHIPAEKPLESVAEAMVHKAVPAASIIIPCILLVAFLNSPWLALSIAGMLVGGVFLVGGILSKNRILTILCGLVVVASAVGIAFNLGWI